MSLIVRESGIYKLFTTSRDENKSPPKQGRNLPASFAKADAPDESLKQKLYGKRQKLISKVHERSPKSLRKIFQVRDAVLPSENVPKEIKQYIQSFLLPADLARFLLVSKPWYEAAAWLRLQQINQGMPLKTVLPPRIRTAKEAIAWLKINISDSKLLKHADFREFHDFTDNDLKELIELCPNLTHLYLKSHNLTKIETLPTNLQVLDCSYCENLNDLPELPATLRILDCSGCHPFELPKLPEGLQELYCISCPIVIFPELTATLKKLHCRGCPLDQESKERIVGWKEKRRSLIVDNEELWSS